MEQKKDKMNVLLVVGCPDPYDAMVRNYENKQYVVLDLIQFTKYVDLGYDVEQIIKQLITHEIAHICIHKKYPVPTSQNYQELLKHITFDEGFAHILSFSDNIETYDFTSIVDNHFKKAFLELQKAMKETDLNEQKNYLNSQTAVIIGINLQL